MTVVVYKDTLKLYDELISGGCSEDQARVHAEQLGLLGEFLNDIKQTFSSQMVSLRQDFDDKMIVLKKEIGDVRRDLGWMHLIGSAMIVAFLTDIFAMRLF
mgnify:CR=1 FL=1